MIVCCSVLTIHGISFINRLIVDVLRLVTCFLLFQMNFDTCSSRETTYPCSIFDDRHPSTVSMTVLVVVEMFNALNNLSENQSLLWVFSLIFDLFAAFFCLSAWSIDMDSERLCKKYSNGSSYLQDLYLYITHWKSIAMFHHLWMSRFFTQRHLYSLLCNLCRPI